MSEQYDKARASSSSSLNSSVQDAEDERTIANILSEEQVKDDRRLGKRLSHLDSIPHTPRINGEIPDVNDATLDHERLSERLITYGLAEMQVEGDGNCQFRAIADQLFRNPEYHKHVRKEVVKQLKNFQKSYESYVPMKYKTYLKKMKRSGEWGDHLTLQAAADRFVAKICLLTSFRETCFIEILPKDQSPSRELWLSFWSEVHYNSLYGSGDVPTRVAKKKALALLDFGTWYLAAVFFRCKIKMVIVHCYCISYKINCWNLIFSQNAQVVSTPASEPCILFLYRFS